MLPYIQNNVISKSFKGGIVYYEEEFPNILFAKDGEIYDFYGKKVLVIGEAYSVDKEIRILRNLGWWKDEQPGEETKNKVLKMLDNNLEVDVVLIHTCPYKYLPYEVFFEGVAQSKVHQSTEEIFDKLEFIFETIKELK